MTASAEQIDRALLNNVSPRHIAAVYKIALSKVLARLRIKGAELDRQEILRKERERQERAAAARMRAQLRAKIAKTDEERYEEWCALDVRYEDDPRSAPFNTVAGNMNASYYARRVQHWRTLAGVVSYQGKEAA